ncbi:MAG: hypothetical protein KIS78_20615 [Labilithrix sp.]|nr:hypothetical protein [Labilithrix sp.]
MSLGPKKREQQRSSIARVRGLDPRTLDPRVRLRLALAGGGAVLAVALFATCGGCGKRPPAGDAATAAKQAGGDASAPAPEAREDAETLRDPRMWARAMEGELEDLATLATHEGAIGLVEATTDPALRPTAIRAMAYAPGWAQLPYLAKAARAKDDEEARLALESTVELAARPRRAEDPEDAEELREGCDGLTGLARNPARPRSRRILAIRALRMMPCPPAADGEALPTDLDAR